MKRLLPLIFPALMGCVMESCGSEALVTSAVSYQSVRTEQYKAEVPDNANILVVYDISADGELSVTIKNLSDEILIIDQTKSFFVNTDGQSTSYYDPTVRTTAVTDLSSETTGASVNLGAVGGALGIGGKLGGLLSGINVGGSDTNGSATTVTTMVADQPQFSIGPKGMGTLSKKYNISGIGRNNRSSARGRNDSFSKQNARLKFSVCVSYSFDNGQTFDKIVTPFYENSNIISPLTSHGKVNDALRNVLTLKTDALNEQWWLLHSVNNKRIGKDYVTRGYLIDYK